MRFQLEQDIGNDLGVCVLNLQTAQEKIKITILAASHHPDKLGDNRYCDKSDLMFLICHVTSHNHLFKRSCDFMIGSPSP